MAGILNDPSLAAGSALAQGVQGFLTAYRQTKKDKLDEARELQDQAIKKKQMDLSEVAAGYTSDPNTGALVETPEHQLHRNLENTGLLSKSEVKVDDKGNAIKDDSGNYVLSPHGMMENIGKVTGFERSGYRLVPGSDYDKALGGISGQTELTPEGREKLATERALRASQIAKNNAEAEKKTTEARTPKGTKGQEAVDKAFGKSYEDWVPSGGYAAVDQQLKGLEAVLPKLQKSKTATGMVGLIPKSARDILTPESANMQDMVENVVQRSLRQVLGAQFTEQEGKQLMARAYNPRQSPEINAQRVQALVNQIRKMAQAKESAAKYFEENGTLTGYKGPSVFSTDQIQLPGDAGLLPQQAPQSNQQLAPQPTPVPKGKIHVTNGKESFFVDPADLPDAAREGFQEVK